MRFSFQTETLPMIAELEQLNEARTRGEWRWREEFVEEDGSHMRTLAPGILILDNYGGGPWGDDIDKTNAHFIVAAANAMPRLLALLHPCPPAVQRAARGSACPMRVHPRRRDASTLAPLMRP